MSIPFDDTQIRQRALELLDQVKVNYFSVEPTNSGPFRSQTLRWSVDRPPGVGLTINNIDVESTGTRKEELTRTKTFRLIAHVSVYTKLLGTATVNVNLSSCMIASSGDDIESMLSNYIKVAMENSNEFADFYFPDGWDPEIKITNNDFFFKIKFKKSQSWFPDPEVTLAAHFAVGVQRLPDPRIDRFTNKAVAYVKTIHSDVAVPWWAWGIPGAVPALIIVLGSARDDAKAKSRGMCQNLTDLLMVFIELINGQPPQGYQIHDVLLYESQYGNGIADARYCPIPSPPVLEE